MLLKWICFLAIVASLVSQGLLRAEDKQVKLTVEKITQILREDDPTGRNHSIKLTVSPYEAIPDVTKWRLTLHTPSNGGHIYDTQRTTTSAASETEIVFKGNLVDINMFQLKALDSDYNTKANILEVADFKDFESRIAYVGEDRTSSSTSQRVVTGRHPSRIHIGKKECQGTKTKPCYVLAPSSKPETLERCLTVDLSDGDSIKQCDERVTPFIRMSQTPSISLKEEGNLEVAFIYQGERYIEVVAYDHEDSTNVFSENGYGCKFPLGMKWTVGEEVRCIHKVNVPEGQEDNMVVLVVALDRDHEVVGSSLSSFSSLKQPDVSTDKPHEPDVKAGGMIVGVVIGSLVGVGLIILLVFSLKKKLTKKSTKNEFVAKYSEVNTKPENA